MSEAVSGKAHEAKETQCRQKKITQYMEPTIYFFNAKASIHWPQPVNFGLTIGLVVPSPFIRQGDG